MTDTSEVTHLADVVHAVCAGKEISVAGPALVLALHAVIADTGAAREQQTLVAEELMRRLGNMINAPKEQ